MPYFLGASFGTRPNFNRKRAKNSKFKIPRPFFRTPAPERGGGQGEGFFSRIFACQQNSHAASGATMNETQGFSNREKERIMSGNGKDR